MQQRPTCTGLRVRSPSDAHVIFHAVSLNMLPIVSRRLDTEERRSISSGCVFVWEERGANAEATGLGIERWTDSIRWGPSRVRDEFLFYHEKEPGQTDMEITSDSDTLSRSRPGPSHGFLRNNLVKQTYSVFVETRRGRRKWHLIAYFTQDSLDYLRSIDEIPELASLHVPQGKYKSARSAKGRPRDQEAFGRYTSPVGSPVASPSQSKLTPCGPVGQGTSASFRQNPRINDKSPHHIADQVRSRRITTKDRSETLAPLAYLQAIPPPRRHPLDEKALMSFTPRRA